MITHNPRHPNHLSQDPDSILRTFLEQFVLVCIFLQIEVADKIFATIFSGSINWASGCEILASASLSIRVFQYIPPVDRFLVQYDYYVCWANIACWSMGSAELLGNFQHLLKL